MLMVDRTFHIGAEGGRGTAKAKSSKLDIHRFMVFGCHFIGDPVMPCLGLDAMWQPVGFFPGWMGGQGAGGRSVAVKSNPPAKWRPEARKLTYHIHMRRVILRKLVMGIADDLDVDGRTIYLVKTCGSDFSPRPTAFGG